MCLLQLLIGCIYGINKLEYETRNLYVSTISGKKNNVFVKGVELSQTRLYIVRFLQSVHSDRIHEERDDN